MFWTRHKTRPDPSKFDSAILSQAVKNHLNLKIGVEYWLDGGVMNREKDSGGELVFYDILFLGHYLFLKMTQTERLRELSAICKDPLEFNSEGVARKISDRLWLTMTFAEDFNSHLRNLLEVPYIEGLILRKSKSVIDNFGRSQYEASWIKRCRVK